MKKTKTMKTDQQSEQSASTDGVETNAALRELTEAEVLVKLAEEKIPKKYYDSNSKTLKHEQKNKINEIIDEYFQDRKAQLIAVESNDEDKKLNLITCWLKTLFKYRIGYAGFLDLQNFSRILEQHKEKIIYLENFTRKKILDSRDILFISNFSSTILNTNDQKEFHSLLLNIYQKRGIVIFILEKKEIKLLIKYMKENMNIYSIKQIDSEGEEKTSIFKSIELIEA